MLIYNKTYINFSKKCNLKFLVIIFLNRKLYLRKKFQTLHSNIFNAKDLRYDFITTVCNNELFLLENCKSFINTLNNLPKFNKYSRLGLHLSLLYIKFEA